MIDIIINKNIKFLQKYGIGMETEDDKDVYRYGLQIIYSYIISISVILSISVLFNRFYETAIMLFVFAVLQVFNGGYHAGTKLKCQLLTVMGSMAGNIWASIILNHSIFMIISAVILSVVIIITGPVENKNHPVSKKTYKRSKRIVRIIALLNFFATITLVIINKNIEASVIVSTLFLYVISLSSAKIKTSPDNT